MWLHTRWPLDSDLGIWLGCCYGWLCLRWVCAYLFHCGNSLHTLNSPLLLAPIANFPAFYMSQCPYSPPCVIHFLLFLLLTFFSSFDLSPKITHHTFSPPLFLPFSLLVIKPLDLISTPTRMCHTFHPLPRWRRWRTIWSWKYKYSKVCAETMKVLNGDIVTAFF